MARAAMGPFLPLLLTAPAVAAVRFNTLHTHRSPSNAPLSWDCTETPEMDMAIRLQTQRREGTMSEFTANNRWLKIVPYNEGLAGLCWKDAKTDLWQRAYSNPSFSARVVGQAMTWLLAKENTQYLLSAPTKYRCSIVLASIPSSLFHVTPSLFCCCEIVGFMETEENNTKIGVFVSRLLVSARRESSQIATLHIDGCDGLNNLANVTLELFDAGWERVLRPSRDTINACGAQCANGRRKSQTGGNCPIEEALESSLWICMLQWATFCVAVMVVSSLIEWSRARQIKFKRNSHLDLDRVAITYGEIKNSLNGTMGWLRSIATNEKVSSDNELTEFVSDALACTERALSSLNALSSTLQLEVRKVEPEVHCNGQHGTNCSFSLQCERALCDPCTKAAGGDNSSDHFSHCANMGLSSADKAVGTLGAFCADIHAAPSESEGVIATSRPQAMSSALLDGSCQGSERQHALSVHTQEPRRWGRQQCRQQEGTFEGHQQNGTQRPPTTLSFTQTVTSSSCGLSGDRATDGFKLPCWPRWSCVQAGLHLPAQGQAEPRQANFATALQVSVRDFLQSSAEHNTGRRDDAYTGAVFDSSASSSAVVSHPSHARPLATLPPPPQNTGALPTGLRVLVADDIRMNLKLMHRVLQREIKAEWAVETAETAEEATERVLSANELGRPFSLVIFDENFGAGRMSGSKAISRIRHAGLTKLVVVSCTGDLGSSVSTQEILACGADAVWGKPFPSWTDGSMQNELANLLRNRLEV